MDQKLVKIIAYRAYSEKYLIPILRQKMYKFSLDMLH